MTKSDQDVESRRGLVWPVLCEWVMITKLSNPVCGTTLCYSVEKCLFWIQIERLVELCKV